MKKYTIIDTFGFLFRSYYASHHLDQTVVSPTGPLTGFMNFIAGIGKKISKQIILFCIRLWKNF